MVKSVSSKFNGWRRVVDNAGSVLVATSQGQDRFQLGSAALANQGADTAALLHGLGTSTTPVQTTSGNVNFLGYWVQSDATSGDVRGMYMRLFLTGAGGTGEAARLFTTVTNVAASTARGAHISLSFAASGTVTGLGAALECTLHLNSGGTAGGNLTVLKLAVNSDGASSDPAGSVLSYIRIDNQGSALDDVDDDAYLFDIQGHTIGDGNLVEVAQAEVSYEHNIRIRVGSTIMYLMCADDRA